MTYKQMSWRRSKQALSLILLFSTIALYPMEEPKFLGEPISHLETAFDRAPSKIQALYQKAIHPEYRKIQQVRAAFFVGEPGTEKTVSAKAFAYKLRELYNAEYIDCVDYTNGNRGGTVVGLRTKIEEILKLDEQKGVIIILDEIQEFLDYAEDSHYDTASTGRYITKLMNDSRLDEKIYIIATLNNLKTFPVQIKSRMRARIIKFRSLVDPQKIRQAFFIQAARHKIQFDDSCTERFFKKHIDSIEGYSGRDFESLADLMVDQFILSKRGSLDNILIRKTDILAALRQMKEDIDDTPYSTFDRNFEQRERHHQDSMRAHEEAMYYQREQMTREENRRIHHTLLNIEETITGRPVNPLRRSMADGSCNVM